MTKIVIQKKITPEKLKDDLAKKYPNSKIEFSRNTAGEYVLEMTEISLDEVNKIIAAHEPLPQSPTQNLAKAKQINLVDIYNAKEIFSAAMEKIIDTIEAGHERLIALETAHKKLQSIVVSNAKNVVDAYKESEEKT